MYYHFHVYIYGQRLRSLTSRTFSDIYSRLRNTGWQSLVLDRPRSYVQFRRFMMFGIPDKGLCLCTPRSHGGAVPELYWPSVTLEIGSVDYGSCWEMKTWITSDRRLNCSWFWAGLWSMSLMWMALIYTYPSLSDLRICVCVCARARVRVWLVCGEHKTEWDCATYGYG